MNELVSHGNVIALGAAVVLVLALVAKLLGRKPKRAEKWEKAEIMRQLLALSERENTGKPAAPSVRLRPSPTRPVTRPGTAHMKASAKTNLPARSKVR
jgi:hypothetical protein